MLEVQEFTAPSHWASALVNGDYSGLDDDDAAACDAFASSLPDMVVSCEDEEFFTWNHDAAPFVDVPGATCLTYIVLTERK